MLFFTKHHFLHRYKNKKPYINLSRPQELILQSSGACAAFSQTVLTWTRPSINWYSNFSLILYTDLTHQETNWVHCQSVTNYPLSVVSQDNQFMKKILNVLQWKEWRTYKIPSTAASCLWFSLVSTLATFLLCFTQDSNL